MVVPIQHILNTKTPLVIVSS